MYDLEAYAELLALLRPFFPKNWATLPTNLSGRQQAQLANDPGQVALCVFDELPEALRLLGNLLLSEIKKKNWQIVIRILKNISVVLDFQNRPAKAEQFILFAIDLATLLNDKEEFPWVRLTRFQQLFMLGRMGRG